MAMSTRKAVGEEDYRSRYFDDLDVGERFHSRWHRLTEDQILDFAEQFDPQFFHADPALAKTSRFGGLIASGAHTFAYWNLINLDVNGDIAWIAGLGFDEFRFPQPLRPGVEFRCESELLAARLSESDPSRGIVTHRYELRTRATDQAAEAVVFTARCVALVERQVKRW